MQQFYIIAGILAMFVIIFAVKPFATDGYENISDRTTLEEKVANAILNGQTELYIDYSGEDFSNMKNWFKEDFKYDKLINYIDEFSIYNYDGAKYSYWSYGDKKRVKVTIYYKLTNEQIMAVNSFADTYINDNNLKEMSQYEAIKYVHDYLVNNFSYTQNAYNVYEMMDNGQANCYGYTMMNYVILNRLGIPVRTTYGAMNDSHIWNAIQLDGQWYYEDITWDTVDKGTSYFLISSEQIQRTHKIYGNFIPNCPSNYVPISAKPDVPENIEPPTEEVESTLTPPIQESEIQIPKEEDKIQTEDTESSVESEEKDEDIIEDEPTTHPKKEDASSNNSDISDSDVSNNSNSTKENKIQKLMRLLKTLKKFSK